MPAATGLGHSREKELNQGIQGLRGVAILLVLLNHAGVPGFDGGFIGVDIFFVISGYLIGGLLLRELTATGRIDLWAFYARRCRRLLPACLVLLLAVMGCVLWLYAPAEHFELMSSVRASALYAVNLWLAGRSTDYFLGHTEANPLLHLWSLAVEEQFYIIWPLLMLGAWALLRNDPRRATLRLVVVVGVLSLVACIVVSNLKFSWAFYLTPTRMWEFCAGMVIVALPASSRRLRSRALSILGLLSLLTLAVATVLVNQDLRYPGAWALIPVLATVGLLVVAEHESTTLGGRVLRLRPLRWLGDCSYSVYLWHWPLLIFAAVIHPRTSVPLTAFVVGLTLLLGWLSYRWIEQPFKHGLFPSWSSRRLVSAALGLCLAVAASAHVLGRLEIDANQAHYRKAAEWTAGTRSGCLVKFDAVDQPPCEFGSATPRATVVLFGDSHAMQWFTPLVALAEKNDWRLVVLAKVNCPSVDMVVEYYLTRTEYSNCTAWRENMFQRLQVIKPDLVVIASSSGYGIPLDRRMQGLASTMQRVRATGAEVVYVADTPSVNFDVPTCLSRAQWRGIPSDRLCTYPRAREQLRYGDLSRAEASTVKAHGGEYLDFPVRLCSQPECPTEQDGVVMFMDRNHLTEAYATKLAPELEGPLQRLLQKRGP